MLLKSLIIAITSMTVVSRVFSQADDASSPILKLKQGRAVGKTMISTEGKEFYAFLGIPYGKIPSRFERAQFADKWDGIFSATQDGPVCRQFASIVDTTLIGAENCLYLNVYFPKGRRSWRYPVMAFIHGGGFVIGSASSTSVRPHVLMNKDIVLVAMNYRLQAPGFLSTGDEQASGNFGLLDQNLALQWIQQNIRQFGGNPHKVTIFGQSAGGASVIFHLLSPLSKGLFHAAIAESGSAIAKWAITTNPLQTTQQIAQKLQCPTGTTAEMVACLRNVPIDALILNTRQIASGVLTPIVAPVIENPTSGQFLTASPLSLLRKGRFNKVPLISGVTQDEMTEIVLAMQGLGLLSGLNENSDDEKWAKIISSLLLLLYPDGTDLTPSDFSKIKTKYFQGANFNNISDVTKREIELSSEGGFKSPNDETIRLIAAAGVPVYMYVLDQIPYSTTNTRYSGKPDVVHSADLIYLFNASSTYQFSDKDVLLSRNMVDMWTNFAHLRNPTPFRNSIRWTRVRPGKLRYLNITYNLSMNEGYQTDDMQFWHDILFD